MRFANAAPYGIDAPGVLRNFAIITACGGFAWAVTAAGPWRENPVARAAGWACAVTVVYCALMVAAMLYGSLVGKRRTVARLLELIPWTGTEAVLDVGCGRGLMAVAAARRLSAGGHVVGVDRWSGVDQSGNTPSAAVANARRAGFTARVRIVTGDARYLPHASETFDVVVSHWVVHNLTNPADRAAAVTEMVRVLRPGGTVVLADIQDVEVYLATLRRFGFTPLRHVGPSWGAKIFGVLSWGNFCPSAVIATRPADMGTAIHG